ncbi:MAG: hybrid sensor histidine kinase/response regulator [Candidatus Abyssobacteria bacterium SURF_5]|uniref:histidine kinase n=1 Tax=Abyssobacteria bacterium (strain SURF_5) TaxID=2093360 RepID=A0A3A4NV10_ABYX5|nr:MAG: hybrid sensor histidine kinase/response regulator [Candidatus Abyssubacteria bacterium SURF_5]
MKTRQDILLLIESDPACAAMIRKLLAGGKRSYRLEWKPQLLGGVEYLKKASVSAVLLNPDLSDSRGRESLDRIQKLNPHVPIVILLDRLDENLVTRLLRRGAQDYILKDELNTDILVRTIRHARERKKAQEALRKSEQRCRRIRRNLEETVEKKAAQLRKAENLASIGRMVSTLAHEIRNPLQTITMAADNLRKVAKDDREAIALVEEIGYGANLLALLVNDLLVYSRQIDLQYSSQPIRAVIEQPLKKLTDDASHVTVRSEIENPDRQIRVDLPKIQLALENLLRNAIESMPTGGILSIGCRFRKRKNEEFVKITITDTGVGMNQEQLSQLDEPFLSTKPLGTGLGFPTAKKIIEAHKGSLKVDSRPGKGTAVQILLPLSAHKI